MISHLRLKIWNFVPLKIKHSETLEIFWKKKNESQVNAHVGSGELLM